MISVGSLGNQPAPKMQQKNIRSISAHRYTSLDLYKDIGGFMIRKSLALFVLGVAAGTAAYAQKDITPPAQPEAPQTFAWTFDGDGGYLGVQTIEVTRENF